jgi:dihydropteroate synthase
MLIKTSDNNYFKAKNTICYNGELVDLTTPLVMGILNITPDSFYDGGRYDSLDKALQHSASMLEEGASIIDIGACSTRPGADEITAEEELKRLLPVVTEIRKNFPSAILSVDTFRASVAERVVGEIGDCIINDISGGTLDNHMFETVARLKVPYVLMHIQGTPQTMQQNPAYKNVTKEVIKTLSEGVFRLHEMGVCDVIIDPGFGFGKNNDHNFELFNNLDAFRIFELPLLVGVSRKSMVYRFLGQTPEDSFNGTTVFHTLALKGGATILRVHDVKPAVEAIKIVERLKTFSK